jgi:hypothetical protein
MSTEPRPATFAILSRYCGEEVLLSSQMVPADGEAKIWARIIESQPDDLTPDAATYLLRLRFTAEDQIRMQELAGRSEEGTLTESETREFDTYLHIGNLLAVMQSKARLALQGCDSVQNQ